MFILYFLCGVVGGVLGGMGMGGGTLLIPILTIFFKVSQLNAQAINLIAFIPMAVFALVIHLKNKLVDFNGCLYIIIPGIITCIASSFLAKTLKSEILTPDYIYGKGKTIKMVHKLNKVYLENHSRSSFCR